MLFRSAVYSIEQNLGRVFRELDPYPLFPLDDYFHGPSRIGPQLVRSMQPARPAGLSMMPVWAGPLRFPPIGRTA